MGLVVFNFVGKETQQASTNAQNAIFIDSSLLKHSVIHMNAHVTL